MTRFFKFLPGEQQQQFQSCLDQKASRPECFQNVSDYT